jgi:1-acyl-sn-glycerol-3-phosphate acyltransferase
MNTLRGLAAFALFLANLVFWASAVLVVGLLKALTPTRRLRTRLVLFGARVAERWTAGNNTISDLMLPVRWEVSVLPKLRRDGRYFIVSNHQSAVDIIAIFRIFHRRIPFIRFFMKRSLLFVPLVGAGCAALEFPFMRRYTPEYIARHPEKRGLDLVTTRRACRRYRHIPVAVMNFLEGTRFSRTKHQEQASPHRHLLRPRVGGIAHALAVMGDQLNDFLDVTIAYDCEEPTLWKYLRGELTEVRITVREIDVPREFRTDAITEPGPVRDRFREWVNDLWRDKDELMAEMGAGRRRQEHYPRTA